MPSARYCGSSITSRTSWIGATAASAFSKPFSTSSRLCREIQWPTAPSSSSVCSARVVPAPNQGSSIRSGRPTRRITRSATDWAEVETATQWPSAVR